MALASVCLIDVRVVSVKGLGLLSMYFLSMYLDRVSLTQSVFVRSGWVWVHVIELCVIKLRDWRQSCAYQHAFCVLKEVIQCHRKIFDCAFCLR